MFLPGKHLQKTPFSGKNSIFAPDKQKTPGKPDAPQQTPSQSSRIRRLRKNTGGRIYPVLADHPVCFHVSDPDLFGKTAPFAARAQRPSQ